MEQFLAVCAVNSERGNMLNIQAYLDVRSPGSKLIYDLTESEIERRAWVGGEMARHGLEPRCYYISSPIDSSWLTTGFTARLDGVPTIFVYEHADILNKEEFEYFAWHEIAHALLPKGEDHRLTWLEKARSLGKGGGVFIGGKVYFGDDAYRKRQERYPND